MGYFVKNRWLPGLAALALLSPLSGCLFALLTDRDAVPDRARPNLPPDTFLDVDSHYEKENRNFRVGGSRHCVRGTSDCFTTDDYKVKQVNVHVASAKADGRAVTFHELASAASDDYVRDTDRARSTHRSCRIGTASTLLGYTALLAGGIMLQRAFDEDNPNRDLAIGGYAVAGAGVVGVLGGYLLFGGQHCGESGKLYKKWQPVYEHADATEVRGKAADLYVELANKLQAKAPATEAKTESEEP